MLLSEEPSSRSRKSSPFEGLEAPGNGGFFPAVPGGQGLKEEELFKIYNHYITSNRDFTHQLK